MSDNNNQSIPRAEQSRTSNGVKYILDFDETIFDAKKFKKTLEECGIDEASVSAETFAEIKKKLPDFDIKSLLFKDAIDFLEANAGDCEIVSSFLSTDSINNSDPEKREAFQAEKIALCGIRELLGSDKVHLVGDSKIKKLQELKSKYEEIGEQCVFVDDNEEWIKQAESIGMRAYTMRRERQMGVIEGFFMSVEKGSISTFKGFKEYVAEDTK
jgi:hypothetical protein